MENGDTGRSLTLDEGADRLMGIFDAELKTEPAEKAKAEPEPAERQAREEQEEPEERAEAEDAEEEGKAEQAEPEAEAEESAEDESTEPETVEFTTLSELAEALEKSPDDLMAQLKTTITVQGKSEDVTLAELKAGYQRGRDYSEKTTALKQQREHFEAEAAQRRQSIEAHAAVLSQAVQAAEQLIVQPLDAAQMEQLRVQNPAEWSARIQEWKARADFVQNLKQNAVQTLTQYQQQQQAEQQAALGARLEAERAKLASIPGWGDSMRQELFNYLATDYGYSEQELGLVSDHRIIDLVRKARAFDKLQAGQQAAQKKVSKLPKLTPPGKASTKVDVKRSALEQARNKLRKSGRLDDAAAVLERIF